MGTTEIRNGEVSFWYRSAGLHAERPALAESTSADVVIVGAGMTGLWTAHYLAEAMPSWRILVLEAEAVSYGASGRNGGWLSYGMPGLNRLYARTHGRDAVIDFQRAIIDSIGEVISVLDREGIEADVAHEGEVAIATTPAQSARLREEHEYLRDWGFGDGDVRPIGAAELARDFPRLAGARDGLWSPHGARVQPAKLTAGLAAAVERAGVVIHEKTRVADIRPHQVVTDSGLTVDARWVVCATEGFTTDLPGQRRTWLPKLSSVIATAPLSDRQLGAVNWLDNAVLTRDAAHSFAYIQRTADHRIVLGGPGVPYFYGSGRDRNGETPEASLRALRGAFDRLFPSLSDARFEHTWSGVLGIPRDWSATVSADATTGICLAGGYVGDGLSGSNLAARTLRDLVLGLPTDLARLPWVNKRIRRWEPEPARFIALRGLYGVYNLADRRERSQDSASTSVLARVANRISGRY